jgi:hypothetical protein
MSMGQFDDATDRRTTVLDRTEPPRPEPEPRDRMGIALLALAGVVAAGAIATVVVVTSGGDEPASPRSYDAAGRPTASATTDPALTTPETPTAPTDPAAAPTPAPGATTPPAAGSAPQSGPAALPAGWEARTFQGVTFAVPPGSTAPDLVDPGNADAAALFSWSGPDLGGGIYSHVTMWIYPVDSAPTLDETYRPITVPGADRAHMWSGATGGDLASTTVDVHVVAGTRYINLTATVAAGAAGEQTVRDLVASLVVG